MAKTNGLGDQLYAHGYDISGDIGSMGKIGGGQTPIDVTGIDKSANERIGGLRDGGIDFTAFFNPGGVSELNAAHLRLSLLPTTDVVLTYLRGTGLGSPAAGLIGKQIDYPGKRGNSGEFTFDISAVANGFGIEWGVQATPGKRTDTAATDGDSLDNGASSTFGLQAYLQVFAFTGTSCTVKLQESSDDGDEDDWADVTGGGFTAATGITAQRIQTASDLTVEQYLRVATTGTFSSCEFAVIVVRNEVATVF